MRTSFTQNCGMCDEAHARAVKLSTDRGAIILANAAAVHQDASQLSARETCARTSQWLVARALHRSKLAVCAPRSIAARLTLEWK